MKLSKLFKVTNHSVSLTTNFSPNARGDSRGKKTKTKKKHYDVMSYVITTAAWTRKAFNWFVV